VSPNGLPAVEAVVSMLIRSFVVPPGARGTLLDAVRDADLPLPSECNGHGHCGKCRVRFASGAPDPTAADRDAMSAEELTRGLRLACQHRALSEVRLEFADTRADALIQVEAYGGRQIEDPLIRPGRYGVAVDVGTTTVVVALVDLGTQEVVTTVSQLNPQSRFGADVLSRITYAAREGVARLQTMVVDAVRDGVREAARRARVAPAAIDRITLCGNTTMMYLLRGLDPAKLAVYPFTAEHIQAATADGSFLLRMPELGPCTAELLPGISAYVGADIVSGLYFLGADQLADPPKMLVDIGTNGEIALVLDGRIVCTATAAGPAFEGASTSCGVGSIEGAVNQIWTDDGGVHYSTIGDQPAIGLCGSAIVDMLVYGLESGRIRPSGRMPEPLELPGASTPIQFSQADVRSLQLAKAAIRSGMQMMLRRAGVAPAEIRELWIAGGFGRYLDKEHAARIGLLPHTALDRIETLGNSALGGAILGLYDPAFTRRCEWIVERSTAVDLSSQADFNRLFISNIAFPAPASEQVVA
jgi:uncharacterized 2Fe-2S/4Fe-4S cluster protein (DUF4445 family)